MANPNAKPPAPLVGHKPDCPCPVCRQPKEPAKAWKLPAELTNYIREHGGGPWLASLVRRAKESHGPGANERTVGE